jgi:hypothetical protein
MKFRPKTALHTSSIDAPGPGQYNPNLNVVKTNMHGSRIGTSKRDGIYNDKEALPGPGHFNTNDSLL